jgi:choice-of-anchor B domain-containing protein
MMKFISATLLAVASFGALFSQSVNYNLQLRSTLEYPGQTLANICGYAQNGREYALLGGSKGLIIVDVTDPDAPVTIEQIPGPNNLWKEIKVYQHYAYVTSEGGQGLQIVDLSTLPAPGVSYHFYTGNGIIQGQLNTIHALHIDVTKGFVYLYGSNLFNQGAVILDLNQDPYNPVYVGGYESNGYIHDGYVDNDTLYAAHITDGFMSIAVMTDKTNPQVLGTVVTPAAFTHNSWLLSDRTTLLTTDEDYPSFLTAYDVSDPGNIKELDRFSTGDGYNSIGHNTHILNDYAITSWYIDGFNIVDAHRPDNLVEVGRYDTYAGGGKFNGCWGVYPYLPSGTIVASNIPNENGGAGKLFVCTPTYVRACYVEGKLLDGCTGLPLAGADIEIVNGSATSATKTDNFGIFKTGQATPGNFTVRVSKDGYLEQTFDVTLAPAEVVEINATLNVQDAVDIAGTLRNAETGQVLAGTALKLQHNQEQFALTTNAQGNFTLDCVPAGTYKAAAWGYLETTVEVGADGVAEIALTPGYYDDFEFDLGWTPGGTAVSGAWERGKPLGTTLNNQASNPGEDVSTDDNDQCYVTGNDGGDAGSDDVDNGTAILTSQPILLAGYDDAIVRFWYWFVNVGGSSPPNDKITIEATNGTQTATLLQVSTSESAWKYSGDIHLKNLLAFNNNVRIRVTTADQPQPTAHIVEAAFDQFELIRVPLQSGTDQLLSSLALSAAPNPSGRGFLVQYSGLENSDAQLEVRNLLGQIVDSRVLPQGSGSVWCGDTWAPGAYTARPLKLIRQ